MKEKRYLLALSYIVLFVLIVFCLFPIYWILNSSFKIDREIYSNIPTFWPHTFTLAGYQKLFLATTFLTNVKNSMFVSCIVTALSLFAGMLAAYAIARLKFHGRKGVSRVILYAYLMPQTVMYIPLYILISRMGLANTLSALIVMYPTFVVPYTTWMLISYFRSVPFEIEESAIIDGCSRVGAMFRIVFPLSVPGVVATGVFAFTRCWSEYLYALVSINSKAMKTIPLGLSDLVVDDLFNWGPLMSGAILSTIPILLLYTISSRFMVTGMTAGGVKG